MTNSKALVFALVLLIAGSIVLATLPKTKPPKVNPPNSKPVLPTNDPFGSAKFKSLVGLLFFPTASPTPTGLPVTPTLTPEPITLTPTTPAGATPTPTSSPGGACASMDNGLPNSQERYPGESTSMPATTKQVCAFNNSQYYSLPFRNKKCLATQTAIDKAYERMKTYYPTGWQRSKLKQDWQTVQEYSIKYSFNPLFVIALWIEESAAGGFDTPPRMAQQLGCVYRLNKDDSRTFMPPESTICEQMECLFGLRSVNPSNYAFYSCNYQCDSTWWNGSSCNTHLGFTRGIEFWYNEMARVISLPSNCQIQFHSGADPLCGTKPLCLP